MKPAAPTTQAVGVPRQDRGIDQPQPEGAPPPRVANERPIGIREPLAVLESVSVEGLEVDVIGRGRARKTQLGYGIADHAVDAKGCPAERAEPRNDLAPGNRMREPGDNRGKPGPGRPQQTEIAARGRRDEASPVPENSGDH